MRVGLELFARRWWAGDFGTTGDTLSLLLTPLSWAWAGASAYLGARRSKQMKRADHLTVISIGNLAVGGTGKTPIVSWLAGRLQAEGRQPAVLVGSHGADEAELLGECHPGMPVLLGRDRWASAAHAAAQGANVALLDDGFQHRQLARDLDVVLLSAEDRFPAPALPCGPYRERPSALIRADIVLVTRRSSPVEASRELAAQVDEEVPGLVVGGVQLAVGEWRGLGGQPARAPEGDVVVVCGVARPESFRASVRAVVSGSVDLVAFSDHHAYTAADVARLGKLAAGRPIVITDKDAVKLRAHEDALDETYVLSETVRWDWGEQAFLTRVRAAVQAAVRS